MSPRGRAFLIPAIIGVGVLLVSYASLVLYNLYFPRTDPLRGGVFHLIGVLPFILTGAVAAFLAWRLGAQRWERLAAGVCPAVIVLCLGVYSFLRFRGTSHPSLVLVIDSLISGVGRATIYLLLGTLPFLFPNVRARPAPPIA